ncbi:hypothetical protein C5B90_09765 [Haloferax sp. Atlit-12N]|uniref:DUF5518 domain-containing protein n=1 Tax=Haloferax sp. Atlit-12N TaxID=2077203 RepID=UPI000E22AACA|nr:DUF5518 domain-containing protein [Haloferax sp. Atlit-12N]RDZ63425.1 hypothetical protein C5B90_09765 [Haloferax sp. Atlit-12N]
MKFNMRAIAYGFIATVVVGFLGGLTVPFTNVTLPTVGYILTGIIGGLVAGYLVTTGMADGALNGLVGTTLGAIIVAIGLVVMNVLFAGVFFGLTVFAAAVVIIALAGIPGALGGALGSMLHDRSAARRTRPAA